MNRRTFLASSIGIGISGCLERNGDEVEPSEEARQAEAAREALEEYEEEQEQGEQDAESSGDEWRWSTGEPNSNPVTDGEFVFLAKYDGLHAIEATTGKHLWTGSVFSEANAAPAITDERLYTPDRRGDIFGYNRSGEEDWRVEQDDVAFLESPIVSGDYLYVRGRAPKSTILAISISEEEVLWETTYSLGFPHDDVVYLVNFAHPTGGEDELLCKYADSGEVKWNADIAGGTYLVDNELWVRQQENEIAALDPESGEFIREFRFPTSNRGTLYPLENQLLMTYQDGSRGRTTVYSFDKSGKSIQWEYEEDYISLSSPSFDTSHIYFGGEDGKLRVLDLESGSVQSRYNVGYKRIGRPAITEEIVVVYESNGDLVGIDRKIL